MCIKTHDQYSKMQLSSSAKRPSEKRTKVAQQAITTKVNTHINIQTGFRGYPLCEYF